ncbi:hypothetical protein DFH27DRAFT_529244 [Peziza echinospora]|nr:hypothetical protein DFH27DRAFT_529244 [Peziza echinospora]
MGCLSCVLVGLSVASCQKHASCATMAVWSHVVHNSTNIEVEVLEAGANDSGRQDACLSVASCQKHACSSVASCQKDASCATMAVWSHVVHNSTDIEVEVLGACAVDSGRQDASCANMAVWSHVVHNSTNIEVEVLEAGANDSGRQLLGSGMHVNADNVWHNSTNVQVEVLGPGAIDLGRQLLGSGMHINADNVWHDSTNVEVEVLGAGAVDSGRQVRVLLVVRRTHCDFGVFVLRASCATMAVWSHFVHNSTNIEVEVLGAGAVDSGRQVRVLLVVRRTHHVRPGRFGAMLCTTPTILKLKSWELVQRIQAVNCQKDACLSVASCQKHASCATMAVWSHVVHNSTDIEVEVLGAGSSVASCQKDASCANMAVWSHVVHNSTNIEVEVLEAGANDSGRQLLGSGMHVNADNVWHNSTNVQVEVLGPGAIDLGRQLLGSGMHINADNVWHDSTNVEVEVLGAGAVDSGRQVRVLLVVRRTHHVRPWRFGAMLCTTPPILKLKSWELVQSIKAVK